MRISPVSIPASACNHLVIQVTVGGQTYNVHATKDELTLDGKEEMREAVIARLRSFGRENGYTTLAQIRAGLAGKELHI